MKCGRRAEKASVRISQLVSTCATMNIVVYVSNALIFLTIARPKAMKSQPNNLCHFDSKTSSFCPNIFLGVLLIKANVGESSYY